MTRLRSALAVLGALCAAGAAPAQETVLIRGARIFDGTGAPAVLGNVLVRGDKIAPSAPGCGRPSGAG